MGARAKRRGVGGWWARRGRASGVVAALIVLYARPTAAAEPRCETTLRFDAASGRAMLERDGRSVAVEDGTTVSYSGPVCVVATGMSTGLQQVEVTSESSDTSGLQELLALFQGVKPLAARSDEVVSDLKDLTSRLAKLRAGRGPLEVALDRVHALLEGPQGLSEARFSARIGVVRVAADPSRTEAVAEELKRRLGPAWGCLPGALPGCDPRLLPAANLVDAYVELETALHAFVRSDAAAADQELTEAARKLLDDVPASLASARETEALVKAVVTAKGSVSRGPFRSGALAGLKLRVAVTPRTDAWLQWAPLPGPSQFSLTFRDQAGLRVSAGVLAVVVPGAELPQYGNVGGALAQSGVDDQRLQLGLSFDVTYRWLDWGDQGGPTVWLPHLLVAPMASKGPGFGAGVAVSWWQVKAAIGGLWLQQDRPGAPLGTPIGPGEDVPVSQGYGSTPSLYFGLGVRLP